MSNVEIINQGFRNLRDGLSAYIARELQISFGNDWWHEAVIDTLFEDQKRNLPDSGDWAFLVDSLDILNCLTLFDIHWNTVFKKKLSIDHRTWAKELKGVRHKVAHIGGEDINDDDTWRALDTMSRLDEQIDPDGTEEIRALLRKQRYGSEEGSTSVNTQGQPLVPEGFTHKTGVLNAQAMGLPSWREVIEPHPDVAEGRYKNAEFAANLAQVARGEGAYEYRDPVEFFRRTYVTEGMRGLLVQALKRVGGKDGEPVIQLKTAFGGGKTHSMLALYHMMKGSASVKKLKDTFAPIFEEAGISKIPKVNVAVLVGTALDPAKAKRPINFPGITINTIWGEMAYQLAEASGQKEVYEIIREADRKGVSPGHEALKNLFDACGPCLVLMDELVAYAKKLYGASGLPAGTFDNFITFVQEITEAATASKNSIVVASIPESDFEIGGEAGKQALNQIEHTFGRMESVWKPVAADEGFEVVRRRLFLDCKDEQTKERICNAFSQMYIDNSSDFPVDAKEEDYRRRMIACYPIHPEIFERLYQDWATLDSFQRTRGVLRLMAAVIHELWMGNDASPMIMPGSINFNVPNVRDELTRYLDESWNAIVDREVDGKNSIPYQKDKATPRFAQIMASRRISRTIMLGSAPTQREQSVRGVEVPHIRLGTIQPGENIAVFNDALTTLQASLSYLYTNSSGERFWYDTHPTLKKTMEDRANHMFGEDDVISEIEKRLRTIRKEEPFSGVHICPGSSFDIPDDKEVRLVILNPKQTFRMTNEMCGAKMAVKDYLDHRGESPRIYRNMLAFLAPDIDAMQSLSQTVRRYLAWKSIEADKDSLNLDITQINEVTNSINREETSVKTQVGQTYSWLLVPYIDQAVSMTEIIWDASHLTNSDSIIKSVIKEMEQKDMLISHWAPALLLMELDKWLWKDKDDISIKQLWEYLCTYCYLPRLSNYGVLEKAITDGVASTEYFAIAEGKSDDRYLGLKFNKTVFGISDSDILVKLSAATKQIATDSVNPVPAPAPVSGSSTETAQGTTSSNAPGPSVSGTSSSSSASESERPKNKHFYLSAKLDNTRINRQVAQLVEEVLNHLTEVDGNNVRVTLEVEADFPNGTPQNTVRTVSENCDTLKVDSFGFDD